MSITLDNHGTTAALTGGIDGGSAADFSRPLSARRIPELDGIRGLAILSVLAWHYLGAILRPDLGVMAQCLVAWLNMTWAGVDLFFVLSGFLIGGILLDQRGQPGYFAAFYARRFGRILPSYILLLTVFYLVSALANLDTTRGRHWLLGEGMPAWSYVLYVQNFMMAGRGGFGANALGISWSLAVEEQFYLILPLAVYLFRPVRLRMVLLVLIPLAPLARLFLAQTAWPGWLSAYVLCRWDSLLLGVMGAMAIREVAVRDWLRAHPETLRWGLLVFLLSLAFVLSLGRGAYHSFDMMFLGYTWLAGGALVLLLAGVLQSSPRLSGWLRVPWLGRLGRISYGVYLYHQLVLGLCHGLLLRQFPRISSVADGLVTLLALGLTLLLAGWSWEHFEKGFIDRAHAVRYDRRHSVARMLSWVAERCRGIARTSRR